jgi:hypothetical protein
VDNNQSILATFNIIDFNAFIGFYWSSSRSFILCASIRSHPSRCQLCLFVLNVTTLEHLVAQIYADLMYLD